MSSQARIGAVWMVCLCFGWLLAAERSLAATTISGDINQNSTWSVTSSPYIVSSDIGVSAQLLIEAGVAIQFNAGGSLSVDRGAIRAIGTASQPIKFTSNQANPAPGAWGGLTFSWRTDSLNTVFEYAMFEFGGSAQKGMILINGSSPTFRNCRFQNSGSNGIGIRFDGYPPRPTILDCIFGRNRLSGLTLDEQGGLSVIRDNTFQENRSYPIVTHANSIGALRRNTFTNNTPNMIQIVGGNFTETQSIASMGVPYVVSSEPIVVLGAELTLDAGVTLKFDSGTGLATSQYYGGTVRAVGEASNPILFTSSQEVPSAGDWLGMALDGSSAGAPSSLQ